MRGNVHGLLFPISNKGSFICTILPPPSPPPTPTHPHPTLFRHCLFHCRVGFYLFTSREANYRSFHGAITNPRPRSKFIQKWNVIFNERLNTFNLQLCGVGHMTKDNPNESSLISEYFSVLANIRRTSSRNSLHQNRLNHL